MQYCFSTSAPQFRTHQKTTSIQRTFPKKKKKETSIQRRITIPRKNLPVQIHLQWKSRSICIHHNFPLQVFFRSPCLYQEEKKGIYIYQIERNFNQNKIELFFSSQVLKGKYCGWSTLLGGFLVIFWQPNQLKHLKLLKKINDLRVYLI